MNKKNLKLKTLPFLGMKYLGINQTKYIKVLYKKLQNSDEKHQSTK